MIKSIFKSIWITIMLCCLLLYTYYPLHRKSSTYLNGNLFETGFMYWKYCFIHDLKNKITNTCKMNWLKVNYFRRDMKFTMNNYFVFQLHFLNVNCLLGILISYYLIHTLIIYFHLWYIKNLLNNIYSVYTNTILYN